MASWKFNAQKAGITIREAVQGEFFSTDAFKIRLTQVWLTLTPKNTRENRLL